MKFFPRCFSSSHFHEDTRVSVPSPMPAKAVEAYRTASAGLSSLAPPPAYDAAETINDKYLPDIVAAIEAASKELRKISLFINHNPELAFKEFKASSTITNYLIKKGFNVKKGTYGMETAFEVIHDRRVGGEGRTVAFQSEYDALPGVGQACGHNLIAISGIAAFLGLVSVVDKYSIPTRVILQGTPAEEGGGGKVIMRKAGAYDGVDVALMVHPGSYSGIPPMLSATGGQVEFFGHTAHAAGAPWEGKNALDAAVMAYNAIAVLRQQTPTSFRIHALIREGDNWAGNIIPDHCRFLFGLRSTEMKEVAGFLPKLLDIFESAAKMTGCTVKVDLRDIGKAIIKDVRHNSILASHYLSTLTSLGVDQTVVPPLGSTDFGEVSYTVPSIHPSFRIPVGEGDANHTRGFTACAATEEAHEATLKAAQGICVTALRAVLDDAFYAQVKGEFDEKKKGDEAFCAAMGIDLFEGVGGKGSAKEFTGCGCCA